MRLIVEAKAQRVFEIISFDLGLGIRLLENATIENLSNFLYGEIAPLPVFKNGRQPDAFSNHRSLINTSADVDSILYGPISLVNHRCCSEVQRWTSRGETFIKHKFKSEFKLIEREDGKQIVIIIDPLLKPNSQFFVSYGIQWGPPSL